MAIIEGGYERGYSLNFNTTVKFEDKNCVEKLSKNRIMVLIVDNIMRREKKKNVSHCRGTAPTIF